jgi:mannonate dehydratase
MEGKGRGGSCVTEYDDSKLLPDENAMKQRMAKNRHKLDYDVFEIASGITADQLFANYEYFMKAIIPIAEECNVKLALHPDDPPVRNFGTIQRMITSQEDYIRAMEIADSAVWGLNLCLGCCSEMGGAEIVKKMIQYFGNRKKIFCVHFRDVQGVLPYFKECFLGEGNFNPAEILYEIYKIGYDGIIMEDHVAKMTGDSLWGHRARAHEIGYIQGMIKMMEFFESNRSPQSL